MGQDRKTLFDIANATDPDGKPAQVIEVLNQTNPILQDAPAYPSNAQMSEKVTLRSTLPVTQFAQMNKGTVRSKGSTQQRVDTIGFLDGLSEVDARLEKTIGKAAMNAHRMSDDKAFLESMNQLVALTMLYGDELTSPQSFTGLAPRMSSLSTAITGSQVRSMGTVTGSDGSSIYIVDWGEDTCHLLYPKDGENGSVAGVKVEDHGKLRVTDADSNPMMAYVTAYSWLVGLTVKDPRHIARLANIDTSDANVASPTQGTLINALIDILVSMPDKGMANRVMYTHRTVLGGFYKQAINKSNAALSIRDYLGKPTAHFWDVPIRSLDQMSAAESTVS